MNTKSDAGKSRKNGLYCCCRLFPPSFFLVKPRPSPHRGRGAGAKGCRCLPIDRIYNERDLTTNQFRATVLSSLNYLPNLSLRLILCCLSCLFLVLFFRFHLEYVRTLYLYSSSSSSLAATLVLYNYPFHHEREHMYQNRLHLCNKVFQNVLSSIITSDYEAEIN